MIEDEFGPQSVADDVKMQSGMPAREFTIGPWIAIIIIISLLFWVLM